MSALCTLAGLKTCSMFWRSIPRATEVLGPSRSPSPTSPSAVSECRTSSRQRVVDMSPNDSHSKQSDGPRRLLSIRKSNVRLRGAARAVIDSKREARPPHFSDVVEEAMKQPSLLERGLKRTKSVASLFRRARLKEADEESEDEHDLEASSAGLRVLPHHQGTLTSSESSREERRKERWSGSAAYVLRVADPFLPNPCSAN